MQSPKIATGKAKKSIEIPGKTGTFLGPWRTRLACSTPKPGGCQKPGLLLCVCLVLVVVLVRERGAEQRIYGR
jgi:hypothetical protein